MNSWKLVGLQRLDQRFRPSDGSKYLVNDLQATRDRIVVYISTRIALHLDKIVWQFLTWQYVGLVQAFEKNACSSYFNFYFFVPSDQYQCNLIS